METKGITTMVCFHDLLGFGNMVSVSGGTLDSVMGEIAHRRIDLLRQTVGEVSKEFPDGTSLFQMNDSAVASCDIDLSIGSSHIDAGAISSLIPQEAVAKRALDFVCASSILHHNTALNELRERIGPAGRTFIVLGKRWPVENHEDCVTDVPALQANLAFSEAYIADSLGSKAGFIAGAWDSIYLNDLMWMFLTLVGKPLSGLSSLVKTIPICDTGVFPKCLCASEPREIEATIFHRKRVFHNISSLLAIGIFKSIRETNV